MKEFIKIMFVGGVILLILIAGILGFFAMMAFEWFTVGLGFLTILFIFGLFAYLIGASILNKKF